MAIIKLFGGLRRHSATHQLLIAGDTVREALDNLTQANAPLRTAILAGDGLRPHVRITVNGHDIELSAGLDTPIAAGDQIAVFPPIAGGYR